MLGSYAAMGQSFNQNFIRVRTPRTKITTETQLQTLSVTKDSVETNIQYFDGLGRAIQTVQQQGSPLGKDMVQPMAYDPYGREAVKYLPYAATTSDGSYKTDALATGAGLAQFYNSTGANGSQQTNGIVSIASPYAQTSFEPSPLNRVIEQGEPGTPWLIAANGTGHTTKIAYLINNATAYATDTVNGTRAALYTVTINADQSRTLVASGYYGAGTLYVTVTKDENWVSGRGHTMEEYKDEEGRVVLKRTYNPGTSNPVLSTYYVYDDFGNLAFVLPPAANADAAATISQVTLDNFCYQYRYDGRNRLTEKKVPGKGWDFTIYNQLDQVTFTQDANQRNQTPQVWTYIQYDALGRTALTGIWSSTGATGSAGDSNISAPSHTLEQWLVTWQAAQTTLWLTPNNTTATGYSVVNPQGTLLTVNYYDDYTFPNNSYTSFTSSLVAPKGLLTGTKTAILNTDGTIGSMLWGLHGYDGLGRETLTIKQHYQGGQTAYSTSNYDITSTSYFFDNQVSLTTRAHIISPSTTPKIGIGTQHYYDHMGRLTQIWKVVWDESLASPGGMLMSKIDYNELGQVKTKHLDGGAAGTTFLQDVPYTYNERGWLNAVGNTTNLFYYSLKYNIPDAGITPQFNGNIAEMLYTGTQSGSKTFNYTYDPLNRLTNATSTSNILNEHISYDMMGNITALTRAGNAPATLAYTYYNTNQSNQLQTVTNGGAAYKSYVYDNNGNATSDGGSKTISYNMLNLPRKVVSGTTTLATYTYDATGDKLENTGSDGTWDYTDGIVVNTFGSTTTQFVQTEEGRAILQGSSYHYEYNLTDHLGNVRASFDRNPTTNLAREIQEDEYYSFGLRKSGGYNLSNNNRYLYNGKEVQTDLTSQYDYGARFYDPVIGRWTSIDPKAELMRRYSPYNYAWDDPMRFVDPDGMAPGDPQDDPFFVLKLLTTVAYDVKHAVFNTANRAVGSPYRERYKTVNGSEVFESEIYKEQAPKSMKQAAGQALQAVGDALAVIPGEGQAGKILTKDATEATTAREANELLNPFELEPTHNITKSKTQMAKLKTDVKENGVNEPIKYVEHNGAKKVVDGHHRLSAAKHAGLDKVPAQQVQLPYLGYKTFEDLIYTHH
jgi:RHS repeat-associated protein